MPATQTRSEVLTVRVTPALRHRVMAAAWIESGAGELDFQASRYLHDVLEEHVNAVLEGEPGGLPGAIERYSAALSEQRSAELRAELAQLEAVAETARR